MAAEKNFVRLGLFAVVGLVVIMATGVFFIQRIRSQAVIEMVTYFSENVSGLDVSSPVRYKGVSVGRVSDIQIDPRGDIVEVDFELFQERLSNLGADVGEIRRTAEEGVFPRTRARVVGNPVTGEGYLLLDVPENPPPPIELGFTPTRAYVASMPSPLATIQDQLPAVLERVEGTLTTLREIVARMPDSLDRSDRFFTNIERIIDESNLPALTSDTHAFFETASTQLTTASEQMARMSEDINRLAGPEGTLVKFSEEARAAIREADVSGSTQAARDAAERTTLAAEDLRRSLPAIRESLDQLRDLARRLEEQPESVIYGPRQEGAAR